MFIAQPPVSFGELMCEALNAKEAGRRQWRAFEFAVAWFNSYGAQTIMGPARSFLASGGCMRATVGLDFGSTTYEGLSSLLDLEDGKADVTTHVFCDENPACTFHPKVFLFGNEERARLFVGSTNMTAGGLDTNVEAALGIVGALHDATIQDARRTLAAWRDHGKDTRIRQLTRTLLKQLCEKRYVLTEEEVRNRRNRDAGRRPGTMEPLFGRSSTRPRRPGPARQWAGASSSPVGPTTGSALGEVLLMRVRPRRNGQQLQISMKVLEASFLNGAKEVVSTNGDRRAIGYNMARGVRNTARFEAPEMMGMRNPVARFQWVSRARDGRPVEKVLQYEIFDADVDAIGIEIFEKLEGGINAAHPAKLDELSQEETVLSKADLEIAQWYRLDSA